MKYPVHRYNAHVLKFKLQYVPFKAILFLMIAFFAMGLMLGHSWGFYSCYNVKQFENSINVTPVTKKIEISPP